MKLALIALPLLMLCAPPLAAKPADFARVLADPARSADNRAMDEGRDPADVLDFAGLRRGDVVADYSAGGGYYTELLASAVGAKGKVLALVGPRYYKADPWDKLRAAHANVTLIVSPNLDLAPRSVDMVFTHLVFHDLFLPPRSGETPPSAEHVLANWFAAVRPGGHVIVADHAGPAGDVSQIAGSLHRIDPAAAQAAMERAGFVLEGKSDVLHRSADDHTLRVFDPVLRGKTDRFVMKFRRP
ncbi:MAG: methyltransferase [Novosphingobium sp.]